MINNVLRGGEKKKGGKVACRKACLGLLRGEKKRQGRMLLNTNKDQARPERCPGEKKKKGKKYKVLSAVSAPP